MHWSPRGYVLRVPLWVLERPLHECFRDLQLAVETALAEFEVAATIQTTAMELIRNSTESRADPGELEIVTRQMIDSGAARRLCEEVTTVLMTAIERADRLGEADEGIAKQTFAVFRQQPS
jgi:hypothetical protein